MRHYRVCCVQRRWIELVDISRLPLVQRFAFGLPAASRSGRRAAVAIFTEPPQFAQSETSEVCGVAVASMGRQYIRRQWEGRYKFLGTADTVFDIWRWRGKIGGG